MKRLTLLVLLLALASFSGCAGRAADTTPEPPPIIDYRADRVEFKDWPQVQFKGVRLLLAETSRLSGQGFAGARPEDFERTLILFPSVPAGCTFTNCDQGYGPVVRDLKIAYLDRAGRLLKTGIMRRVDGVSTPPAGTVAAIEGLP